jgi:hypothetical protein
MIVPVAQAIHNAVLRIPCDGCTARNRTGAPVGSETSPIALGLSALPCNGDWLTLNGRFLRSPWHEAAWPLQPLRCALPTPRAASMPLASRQRSAIGLRALAALRTAPQRQFAQPESQRRSQKIRTVVSNRIGTS